MKYIVYYKGSKCKAVNDDESYILRDAKIRHIWPEDTTTITFTVSNDIISYTISNLSARTQYLYDQGELGLCVLVEENPSWFSRKTWWRSSLSQQNHLTRRCIKILKIQALSGTIDLNDVEYYSGSGCLSKQLYYVFNYSATYQDPYVSSGTENIALGVGRYYQDDQGFRPHKVSDYVNITVYNKM